MYYLPNERLRKWIAAPREMRPTPTTELAPPQTLKPDFKGILPRIQTTPHGVIWRCRVSADMSGPPRMAEPAQYPQSITSRPAAIAVYDHVMGLGGGGITNQKTSVCFNTRNALYGRARRHIS